MLSQRLEAAEMVASELHPLERLIDKTITRGASLTVAMMNARVRGRLSIDQGQGALDHIALANQLMAQARSHVVAAHRELKVTQEDIGIGTYAIGDTSLTPAARQSAIISNEIDAPVTA